MTRYDPQHPNKQHTDVGAVRKALADLWAHYQVVNWVDPLDKDGLGLQKHVYELMADFIEKASHFDQVAAILEQRVKSRDHL